MGDEVDPVEALLADVENPAYRLTKTSRILIGAATLLLEEHAEADRELAAAVKHDLTSNREPTAPALAEKVAELEERIENSKTEFRFVSIGRKAWADIVRLHPPSKDDLKADPRADINSSTFPAAAIAASLETPKMTVEQVGRLEVALPDSEWQQLFGDCLEVNIGGLATPKSLLAGTTLRMSETFANIAANTASPDPSSLAGS